MRALAFIIHTKINVSSCCDLAGFHALPPRPTESSWVKRCTIVSPNRQKGPGNPSLCEAGETLGCCVSFFLVCCLLVGRVGVGGHIGGLRALSLNCHQEDSGPWFTADGHSLVRWRLVRLQPATCCGARRAHVHSRTTLDPAQPSSWDPPGPRGRPYGMGTSPGPSAPARLLLGC